MCARNITAFWHGVHPITRAIAAIVLPLVACGGLACGDHRMSYDKFLAIQAELPETAPPVLPASATQPAPADIDRYVRRFEIGPGDLLDIAISYLQPPSGTLTPLPPFQGRVNREGEIDLPYVGKVNVAGMTLEQAEAAIQNAYVPSYYTKAWVRVELTRPESANVLVTGAVLEPGFVQLPRTQRNLLYAVVGAGGVSQTASGEVTLHRLRQPDEKVSLNILNPEHLRMALALEPLEEGDVVVVEAATPNSIFIGGLVNSPHQQINPPGTNMTILQAIAASGGLRTDVTPSEATLIRRNPDGKDVFVKLPINEIAQGKAPNATLQPGDILWVPDTWLTKVQDWSNRNLFFRAGFSGIVTYNVTGIEFLNRRDLQTSGIGGNGNLEDRFDPFGFLIRQQQLRNVQQNLPAPQ